MLFTSLHSETIFILLIRVFFTISNFSGFFERFWSYTRKKRWEKTLWKISIEFSARVKQWSEHWKHLFGLKQPTEKNFEQFLKENRKKCEICGVFKKKNILWRREKTNIIKVWTIEKWHHSNTKKNTEQTHLNYKKWHFTPNWIDYFSIGRLLWNQLTDLQLGNFKQKKSVVCDLFFRFEVSTPLLF